MPIGHFRVRESCPACGSKDLRTVYSCSFTNPPMREFLTGFYSRQGRIDFEFLEGAEFILERCVDCTVVFQRLVPDDFLAAKLYDEWIDPGQSFSRNVSKRSLERYLQPAYEVAMLVAHFGRPPAELTMLDFGMGWGIFCRMAKAFGCEAYGLEISASRVEYAASQGIGIVSWGQIPEMEFHLIYTEQVFEHLAEPLLTLRHLSRGLRPGGLVKISVPNGDHFRGQLKDDDWVTPAARERVRLVSPLEHLNCFTRKSILRMAALSGLEEALIPLRTQLSFVSRSVPTQSVLRNLAWPIWKNVLRRGTCLFLRRSEQESL